MKVGDLVENTYIGAVERGKLGLVVGFDIAGGNAVLVRYNDGTVRCVTAACLKVVSS
jgi:L-serine deaminase